VLAIYIVYYNDVAKRKIHRDIKTLFFYLIDFISKMISLL